MEYLLLSIIAILVAVILGLLIKIHLMSKAALEIMDAFQEKLSADTNTLIGISSCDPYMRKLAASINIQLRLLRQQRHKYLNGDRELKEAVTNISHDLRTPLTAICGYLDLLEREEKSENTARYLSLIENRVEAMKQLTEELFRYSVILSTEEMVLETIHVNGILEESLAAFYGALTGREIIPKIRICDKRIEKQLNREALFRIFSNILSNVLKYSDGDLEVTLLENGEIRFTNQTRGLDPVQVGRLFDRFFTLETARSSGGLGLSIAKALTEQMGGSIGAEYQKDRLSIFLRFP